MYRFFWARTFNIFQTFYSLSKLQNFWRRKTQSRKQSILQVSRMLMKERPPKIEIKTCQIINLWEDMNKHLNTLFRNIWISTILNKGWKKRRLLNDFQWKILKLFNSWKALCKHDEIHIFQFAALSVWGCER